jgi:hypothetical protein
MTSPFCGGAGEFSLFCEFFEKTRTKTLFDNVF